MTKYCFSLENSDGRSECDRADLPSLEAARLESVRYLVDRLKGREQDLWSSRCWRLTTADEQGLTLFCIEVCATNAPAVSR